MQKWFGGNEVIGLEFDSTDLLSFKTSAHACVGVGVRERVRKRKEERGKSFI